MTRFGVLVAAAALGLAAVLVAVLDGDDNAGSLALTITWSEREGNPGCTYDANDQSVTATIAVDGEASSSTTVTVTVSAYADENTSDQVGSASKTVTVHGDDVHEVVELTMPVSRPAHVGEDRVAACRLESQTSAG